MSPEPVRLDRALAELLEHLRTAATPKNNDDTELHDWQWFAKKIGRSPQWVRHNMDTLPHHKIGRTVAFSQLCVDEFLQQTVKNITHPPKFSQTPRSAAASKRKVSR